MLSAKIRRADWAVSIVWNEQSYNKDTLLHADKTSDGANVTHYVPQCIKHKITAENETLRGLGKCRRQIKLLAIKFSTYSYLKTSVSNGSRQASLAHDKHHPFYMADEIM